MAASSSSLRFSVEVGADQADKTLKALTLAFNEVGAQAKIAMSSVGASAAQAGGSVTTLGDRLKDVKGEMVSSMRTANALAKGFNDILPASSAAGEGIRLLISGLVGGAGIGLAIEAVVVSIKLMKDAWKEAEEAANKAIDAGIKRLDALDKALDKRTPAEKIAQQIEVVKDQIQAREEAIPALQARSVSEVRGVSGKTTSQIAAETAEAELVILRKELPKLIQALADELRGALDKAAPGVAKDSYEQRLKDAKFQAGYGAAYGESEDANLLNDRGMGKGGVPLWIEQEAEKLKAALVKAKRDAMAEAETITGYESGGAHDIAAYNKLKDEDYAKAQKNYNSQVRESIALQQEWGSAIGDVMGKLITQQMNARQALAATMQMVVQAVSKAAIANITSHAAEASAGAAAAEADVPVVGPALAVAAMASVFSAVIAMIGRVPSAEGGWWNTGSYRGLAMIHEREMVLPEREADVIRRGGGGGITVNVGGSIVSERDLEQVLTARDGAVARAERKRLRRRRT